MLKLCKQEAHPSLTGLPETHHPIAFWRQQDASARLTKSYVDAAVRYSIKEYCSAERNLSNVIG